MVLYFVFDFGFLYTIFILANRLASPLLFWPPFYFYIGLPLFICPLFILFLVSPFYSVIKDQFIFICHPFAPATATATAASSRPR